jgi:hypothetical protein
MQGESNNSDNVSAIFATDSENDKPVVGIKARFKKA